MNNLLNSIGSAGDQSPGKFFSSIGSSIKQAANDVKAAAQEQIEENFKIQNQVTNNIAPSSSSAASVGETRIAKEIPRPEIPAAPAATGNEKEDALAFQKHQFMCKFVDFKWKQEVRFEDERIEIENRRDEEYQALRAKAKDTIAKTKEKAEHFYSNFEQEKKAKESVEKEIEKLKFDIEKLEKSTDEKVKSSWEEGRLAGKEEIASSAEIASVEALEAELERLRLDNDSQMKMLTAQLESEKDAALERVGVLENEVDCLKGQLENSVEKSLLDSAKNELELATKQCAESSTKNSDLEAHNKELEAGKIALQADLDGVQKQLLVARASFSELEVRLESEVSRLTADLQSKADASVDLGEFKALQMKLSEAEMSKTGLEKSISDFEKSKMELEKSNAELTQSLEHLEQFKINLEQSNSQLEQSKIELDKVNISLSSEVDSLKVKVDDLLSGKENDEILSTENGSLREKINMLETEKSTLESKFEEQKNEFGSKISALEKSTDSVDLLEGQKIELESTISKLESAAKDFESENSESKTKLAEFQTSHDALQKQLAEVIQSTKSSEEDLAARRSEIVDSVRIELGAEHEAVCSKMRLEFEESKSKISDQNAKLADENSRFENEKLELCGEIEELKNSNQQLEVDFKELKADLETQSQQFENEKQFIESANVKKVEQALANQKNCLHAEILELEEKLELANSKTSEAEITAVNEEVESLRSQVGGLQTQVVDFETKISDLEKEKISFETRVSELTNDKVSFESKFTLALEEEKAKLIDFQSENASLLSKNQQLASEVGNLKEDITRYQNSLQEKDEQLSNHMTSNVDMDLVQNELKELKVQFSSAQNELSDANQKLIDANNSLSTRESELIKANERAMAAEEKIAIFREKVKEKVIEKANEISGNEKQKMQAELDAFRVEKEAELSNAKSEAESLKIRIAEYEARISSNNDEVKNTNMQNSQTREKLVEFETKLAGQSEILIDKQRELDGKLRENEELVSKLQILETEFSSLEEKYENSNFELAEVSRQLHEREWGDKESELNDNLAIERDLQNARSKNVELAAQLESVGEEARNLREIYEKRDVENEQLLLKVAELEEMVRPTKENSCTSEALAEQTTLRQNAEGQLKHLQEQLDYYKQKSEEKDRRIEGLFCQKTALRVELESTSGETKEDGDCYPPELLDVPGVRPRNLNNDYSEIELEDLEEGNKNSDTPRKKRRPPLPPNATSCTKVHAAIDFPLRKSLRFLGSSSVTRGAFGAYFAVLHLYVLTMFLFNFGGVSSESGLAKAKLE